MAYLRHLEMARNKEGQGLFRSARQQVLFTVPSGLLCRKHGHLSPLRQPRAIPAADSQGGDAAACHLAHHYQCNNEDACALSTPRQTQAMVPPHLTMFQTPTLCLFSMDTIHQTLVPLPLQACPQAESGIKGEPLGHDFPSGTKRDWKDHSSLHH